MPLTLNPALQLHLQGEVLTLANLWRITRQDGLVLCYTDCYQNLRIGSLTFKARNGFEASALDMTADASPDNNQLASFFDDDEIYLADVWAGKFAKATIEQMLVNYLDLPINTLPDSKAPLLARSDVGEIVSKGAESFQFQTMGLTDRYKRRRGKVTEFMCPHEYGDANCGVDLAPFTHAVTITATAAENRVLTISGTSQTPPYFANGKITFTNGVNEGVTIRVVAQPTATSIRLLNAPPMAIAAGTTATLVRGCPKVPDYCDGEHSNIERYGGFPHVPGREAFVSGRTQVEGV